MKMNALLLNLEEIRAEAFKVNEETKRADDQVEGIDLLERSIHMDLMDMSIREDTGRRIRTVEAVPKVVAQASAFVSKFLR